MEIYSPDIHSDQCVPFRLQFSTIVLFDTLVVVQGANISKWMAFTLYISFEIYIKTTKQYLVVVVAVFI